MARPGITKEQVFDAAEAIAAEGGNPTVTRIRAWCKGGSPNTITPLLREWRETRQDSPVSAAPDLPDPVAASFRAAWSAAYSEASRQLEGERAALEQAQRDMDQERAELSAEIDRLDTALDTAGKETATALEQERQAEAERQGDCPAHRRGWRGETGARPSACRSEGSTGARAPGPRRRRRSARPARRSRKIHDQENAGSESRRH